MCVLASERERERKLDRGEFLSPLGGLCFPLVSIILCSVSGSIIIPGKDVEIEVGFEINWFLSFKTLK